MVDKIIGDEKSFAKWESRGDSGSGKESKNNEAKVR